MSGLGLIRFLFPKPETLSPKGPKGASQPKWELEKEVSWATKVVLLDHYPSTPGLP